MRIYGFGTITMLAISASIFGLVAASAPEVHAQTSQTWEYTVIDVTAFGTPPILTGVANVSVPDGSFTVFVGSFPPRPWAWQIAVSFSLAG